MKLLTVNVYRRNPQLGALRAKIIDLSPALVLAQEADRLGPIRGYCRLSASAGMPREARAVAVYTRLRGVRVVSVTTRLLSVDVPGLRYVEDRWTTEARVMVGGDRVAAFSVHTNPGDHRAAAAEQNDEYLGELARMMRSAHLAGWTPIAGGDFNTRRTTRRGTPAGLARALDGTTHMHGVDGLVVAKGVKATTRTVTLPGSDHRGVLARVTR